MRAAHHSIVALLVLAGCSGKEAKPGDRCDSIADCVAVQELACSQGACARLSCQRSAACPVGAACVDGICAIPECTSDEECQGRQRCFEGDCRSDICEFKAECEPGEVCIGDPPTCKAPPSRCDTDRDCPNDTYCQKPERTCDRKCTSDASCPDEEYCDGDFCRLRCRTGADCAAADVCVNGRCEPNACDDRTCPDDSPFLDPSSCTCVSCLDDSDCPTDARFGCSTESRCVLCLLKADTEAQCTAQGLKLLEGCCVECAIDIDCGSGSSCNAGRCVLSDPRDCVFDADCPNGARCDLGFCVQPGTRTPCDVQTDCPIGEACYQDGRCRAASSVCEDCPAPSRCVAEPGDTVGSCLGCTSACMSAGCGTGQLCVIGDGSTEGFCTALVASGCP